MYTKTKKSVQDNSEYIIISKSKKEEKNQFGKILVFIFILIISLTILQLNKNQSYKGYERIEFRSAGAKLYANLYYPNVNLNFQEKKPLIIYCHGIGAKRDYDLRIPIEFTKRGFYVVALDYQGHGESGGNINNINLITGIPALAQDCSKLLDKLETLEFFSDVDPTQIGLIGHSLGGMVALMNQALDPRFKVTVGLAPLVNFNPPKYGMTSEKLIPYIPVNLLNEANSKNLLIIHHKNDEMLDFTDHAVKAQQLTNCTLIPLTGFMIGGAHQLYTNEVLVLSIRWFENHFFNSEIINGPIFITFYWNYILIIFNLVLLFIIVIYLTSASSKVFFKKGQRTKDLDLHEIVTNSQKKRQIIEIIISIGAFLINWVIFERIFGLQGVFYASLTMIMIYMLFKLVKYYRKPKIKKIRSSLAQVLKSQLKLKYITFIIICSVYLIVVYMIFSFYYPFSFIWPSNFTVHFFLGYFAFPVFLSIELLLRKIIYPKLGFLKSKGSKN
ncbi:MAG: alpha/beta hydrolase, partial [Promethearchaeota archaeon]